MIIYALEMVDFGAVGLVLLQGCLGADGRVLLQAVEN